MKKKRVYAVLIVFLVLLAGGAGVLYYLNSDRDWNEQKLSLDESVNSVDTELLFEVEPLSYTGKMDAAKEILGDLEFGDYLVVVDISEQREYVFSHEGKLFNLYKVSTGAGEVSVPCEGEECDDDYEYQSRAMEESIWRVRSKLDGPFSDFYGPRVMMLDRKVGDGWIATNVALHGTNRPELLGTPWSLGCIYHDNADIIELFDILKVGDLVVVID
ncbi:L,D-transpeptidase [Candidatus Dojkabacteria bacterium]|nr:L,D-transpeptidase [Candidatus Dojkabacteria bacterium]